MSIGPWQLILILVLIFLIFGARRLPQAMHDLAAGIRSFREGLSGDTPPDEKSEKHAIPEDTAQKSSTQKPSVKNTQTSTTKES